MKIQNGAMQVAVKLKLTDFQPLDLKQVADIAANCVGIYEFYISSDDWDIPKQGHPELGLVFEGSKYKCFGLGGTKWAKEIEERFEPFIGMSMKPEEIIKCLKG